MNEEHTVFDGTLPGWRCKACGKVVPVTLPISLEELVAQGDAFVIEHQSCTPTPKASKPTAEEIDENLSRVTQAWREKERPHA